LQSLESGNGLKRVALISRLLWFLGLGLFLAVGLGIVYGLHPAALSAIAGVAGWIIAECNALRTRLNQWPVFREYVDWNRVQEDLDDHGGNT
jgi:hypothetical protein